MSDAQILALVIAAALGGVGTGLGIAATVMLKRANRRDAPSAAIGAYARWLAARKHFTRASMTFVSTFRALANVQAQPQWISLRRAEANRARTAWREATDGLDTAEAEMIAWCQDASTMNKLAEHPRASALDIRSAIDGTNRDVEAFSDRIELQDRLAAEALRPGHDGPFATIAAPQLAIRFLKGVYNGLDDLADRWARR